MPFRVPVLAAVVWLATPAFPLAAQFQPVRLGGRHQIIFSAGLLTTTSTATTVDLPGISIASDPAGLMGGIGYAYWLEDRVALGVRVAATDVSADVTVTGAGTHVDQAVVAALLFGARYQVARLTASNTLRPYVTLSAGPLIGSSDEVTSGFPTTVATMHQAVLSGVLAVGADLSLGRHVTLGLDAGYLFADDFDQRIGARTNYSSPVFTLSLGILLGSGRVAPSP